MKPYRIHLREWQKNFFDGDIKPSIAKLRKEIDAGNIPGGTVGDSNIYYVLCDNNYNPVKPPTNKHQKPQPTGNPLADKILQNYAPTT